LHFIFYILLSVQSIDCLSHTDNLFILLNVHVTSILYRSILYSYTWYFIHDRSDQTTSIFFSPYGTYNTSNYLLNCNNYSIKNLPLAWMWISFISIAGRANDWSWLVLFSSVACYVQSLYMFLIWLALLHSIVK
jgi:hypothetical protein